MQAEEKTRLRKRKETKLIINVNAVDAFPPVLTVSADQGESLADGINNIIYRVVKLKEGGDIGLQISLLPK